MVTSSLIILHNCAKATENRQIFKDLLALERIAPYVKAEEMETAFSAVLTLSYITEENKAHLLEVGEKVSANSKKVYLQIAFLTGNQWSWRPST